MPTLIDINDPDDVIQFALSAVFMTTFLARGGIPESADEIAIASTVCAGALLRAHARARDAPA